MKLKGDALKVAIAIPLIIAFIVYANIFSNKQNSKFNQFIESHQGKTTVIRYLFHFEGVDKAIVEKYINQKKIQLINRDLDLEYRIEKVIQYALKELKITENEQNSLIQLIETSTEFNIPDVYYREYSKAENIDEKIAVIKVLIKNETALWHKT